LVEGLILAVGLVGFTYYSFSTVRQNPDQVEEGIAALEVVEAIDEQIGEPSTHPLRDVGLIIIGIVGLIIGA
jgi:hypothetical protein